MTETTKKDFRKRVGKHLQELRKDAGYSSAKAFAEKLGFNFNTYTQYEQGLSGFNYEQAWVMADALKCSMDELGGREWPPDGADPLLNPDERRIVDQYRLMDDPNREHLRKTADIGVIASEKDGPGTGRAMERPAVPVSKPEQTNAPT